MIGREAFDAGQQPLVRKGRLDCEADGDLSARRFQALERHGQMIEAGLKFRQHSSSGLGQLQSRRASLRAMKKLDAHDRFQTTNETSDRRGCHVEFVSRRDLAEMAGRRLEGAKRV
jgi:hypothetical protein